MQFTAVLCCLLGVLLSGSCGHPSLRVGVPPPPNWVKIQSSADLLPVHAHRTTDIIIALRQRNVDELEQLLLAVSDPSNRLYGQHLSQEQVGALVGVSVEEMEIVTRWCSKMELPVKSIGKTMDFITVSATPRKLESIFGVHT